MKFGCKPSVKVQIFKIVIAQATVGIGICIVYWCDVNLMYYAGNARSLLAIGPSDAVSL